jgi:hypothetical protein
MKFVGRSNFQFESLVSSANISSRSSPVINISNTCPLILAEKFCRRILSEALKFLGVGVMIPWNKIILPSALHVQEDTATEFIV